MLTRLNVNECDGVVRSLSLSPKGIINLMHNSTMCRCGKRFLPPPRMLLSLMHTEFRVLKSTIFVDICVCAHL